MTLRPSDRDRIFYHVRQWSHRGVSVNETRMILTRLSIAVAGPLVRDLLDDWTAQGLLTFRIGPRRGTMHRNDPRDLKLYFATPALLALPQPEWPERPPRRRKRASPPLADPPPREARSEPRPDPSRRRR